MEKITIKNPKNTCIEEEFTSDDKSMVMEVYSLADVSDGYHTFAELYDHRITLFIALARLSDATQRAMNWQQVGEAPYNRRVWRSKNHSDGEPAFGGGWFVLGINKEAGNQVTYHLPLSRWDDTNFAETLEQAPEWDEHTSADVLKRLKDL